ncbi:MAG: AAA family ATPase [Candidatus Babeliales bacterium]|jgi:ATPase family AAA domain-containing protein 3A/B
MFLFLIFSFLLNILILNMQIYAGNQSDTNAFNVGGFNIKLDDAAKIAVETAKVLDEISRDTREGFDRKRTALEQEKIMLVKKKEQGAMTDLEFQVRMENVDTRMKKLETDIERAEKTGDAWNGNIQEALKGGWQMILAKQQEETTRRTQVAVAAAAQEAKQQAKNQGDMERLRFWFEKENMVRVGVLLTAASAGIFASYYGLGFGFRYLESIVSIPSLIQETSIKSLNEQLKLKLGITKLSAEHQFTLDDVILAPDIKQKITRLADETKKTHEWGIPYRHMVLYGPPGTGKTMIARIIARKSGMNYAIIKGAGLLQYSEQLAIQKLHEIFDWAENGKRGLVILFDEADSFLRNRKGLDSFRIALVDAFLSRTNSSSEKYMLILATNHPEDLDPAVLSRIDQKIEIPLPGLEQREAMLKLYLDKYIKNGTFKININGKAKEQAMSLSDDINQELIRNLSQKIEGFSGRDIEKMVAELKVSTISSGKNVAQSDNFIKMVDDSVAQHKKCSTWNQN